MAKKRNTGRKELKSQEEKALSRREFFKGGAAAGVGAAVLSGTGEAQAQAIQWNYEVDVVVLGSGCVGLHAAVTARDLGVCMANS
jgi:Zn-dependent alcohol dehydrogenase